MRLKYLRKIDTFGVPIDLCFEKKKMHKTPWGGFWTLIVFLFSLTVFLILGLEIIYRQQPNIISIEQLERNSHVNLNKQQQQKYIESDKVNNNGNLQNDSRATYYSSGLILAIAALDADYKILKDWSDSFKITGYIIDQRGFNTVYKDKIIEFEKCCKLHQIQEADHYNLFNDFDLSDLLCIKNNELLDHYFTGQVGSEIYNHLQIQVSFKEPINQNIKQKLKNVGMFFTDQILDVQNFSNPLTKYRKNIILKVSSDNQYQILVTNQHAQIRTDVGIIWSDYLSQNFFSLKDYKVSNEKSEENTLLVIKTETDPKLIVYNRNYMKLTDLLATLGGFIKALLIAGFVIANPVSKLSLKTELINRLFNFEGIEEYEEDQKDQLQYPDQNNQQICLPIQQDELKESKIFTQDLKDKNLSLKEKQKDSYPNQIQFNFLRKNNNNITSQYSSKTGNNEGKNLMQTENIITTAANILTTNPSNIQPIKLTELQKNQSQYRASQLSLPRMSQLNLHKYRSRKYQSMDNASAYGFTKIFSNKESSPNNSQQNQQQQIQFQNQAQQNQILQQNKMQIQKDKVKLVRTMLKSYASQHSMKQEDCLKASTILGTRKKEDPDAVFKKLFKSNEKTLIMNLWDYFKYFLGLKKEVKNKQIKFSMRKVNERLDIVFIMKKLIEVDKLKMLFLNENQRKIFEYLPRPIVSLDPEKQLETELENYTLNQAWARQMIFNDKNYISKASEAMLAYQDIIQKGQELDPLDQKLIEMLDESKKQYFQAESPVNSPSLKAKRNNLSIINSINHTSAKQQDVFLKGLQNISPAESIELNEKDIQEIKIQELNNKNEVNQQYNNTTCFNKKNTMHFIRQRTCYIGELNSEKEISNNIEEPIIPSSCPNNTNIETQLKNTEYILNSQPLQQQDQMNQHQHSKTFNSQQDNQDENKQNKAIPFEFAKENHNSKSTHSQSFQEQQSSQTVVQIQKIENYLDSSCKKLSMKSPSNCQYTNFLKNDSQNDINVPKNSIKTPTQGTLNQFFSPQNDSTYHFSYQKNSSSDDDIEAYRNSSDKEINNDFDKCPPLAEEKVITQTIKDTKMIPSQQDYLKNLQNDHNQIYEAPINQKKTPIQNENSGTSYNQNMYQKQYQCQNMKTLNNSQNMKIKSLPKHNDQVQINKEQNTNKDNSLLNISIEPFSRFNSCQNYILINKDPSPIQISQFEDNSYYK